MKRPFGLSAFVLLAAIMLVGCGSNSSSTTATTTPPPASSGSVYITGEDAPLSSVVGLNITITSITLNGQNNKPQILSTPTTVDFARLIGMRSPLAFNQNSVPVDTYSSATFVLASPVINYIDMTQTPPALNTIQGQLPQSPYSVTINFPIPLTVGTSNNIPGLKMEFDIRQSLPVDSNGNVTGAVNPVIYIKATHATDSDAQMSDLTGGLVSVNAASNSFVIQGPYGHQWNVSVNDNTVFNGTFSISNLAAPAFVAVDGYFLSDGSLMASAVEVITTNRTFISGRVLQVTNNASGQAQSVVMWVGETGADLASYVDTVQTINISGVSQYDICFTDGPLTSVLFNSSSMIVGQRVFIGGTYGSTPSGTTLPLTPVMISLRRQAVYGALVPASATVVSGNVGTFQLTSDGLVQYSAGGPVTVHTHNYTFFFDAPDPESSFGLSTLASDTTAAPLIVRGLFLDDTSSGSASVRFHAGLVVAPPQPTN